MDGSVTILEAARALGISEWAVRRRVRSGKLKASLIGREWRVYLADPPPISGVSSSLGSEAPSVSGAVPLHGGAQPPMGGDDALGNGAMAVQVLAEALEAERERANLEWIRANQERQRVEQLEKERVELYGRLGFYQSEIQHLKNQLDGAHAQFQLVQARLLELEAPKEAASAVPNLSTPEQNGQGSIAQTVSTEPHERSQVESLSESSAPPSSDNQGESSGGAFKRFWRWLMQPV